MGKPSIIQSDNGREIDNHLLKEYFIKNNIKHIFGSPYHPQSQGSVEALIRQSKIFLFLLKIQQRMSLI